MAIFRKVHTSFWEDTKVSDDMTPEDRYFLLYLLTNPHSNQVGCFEISPRQMAYETGYNQETIIKLIDRFENILKIIQYDKITKEIFIKNWERYNWSKSPKVISCVLKEAKSIKSIEFRYSINTLLIEYGYSIDTQSQEEEEKEEEKEEKEKIDIFCDDRIEKIFSIYQANCPDLCKLTRERRSKKHREAIGQFLQENDYDFDYFIDVCKKANDLKVIAKNKIDLLSLLNNHIGIISGKYKQDNTIDFSGLDFS